MAKVSDVKKAISTLGTAKKAVATVIGDIANVGFMPIEAELERQLGIAKNAEKYAGLSPEELTLKLEAEKEGNIQSLVDEANEQLAKLMEARNPKPKAASKEDETENDPDEQPEPTTDPVDPTTPLMETET